MNKFHTSSTAQMAAYVSFNMLHTVDLPIHKFNDKTYNDEQ